YNDGFQRNLFSFAYNIHTYEGGTHEQGFRTALTRAIKDYARKSNFIKKDDNNFTYDDVIESMTEIFYIKNTYPNFKGKTKKILGNSDARTVTESIFNDACSKFLFENPDTGKIIVEKGLMASRSRVAAKKARELTRRKSALEISNLPGKLSDCSS